MSVNNHASLCLLIFCILKEALWFWSSQAFGDMMKCVLCAHHKPSDCSDIISVMHIMAWGMNEHTVVSYFRCPAPRQQTLRSLQFTGHLLLPSLCSKNIFNAYNLSHKYCLYYKQSTNNKTPVNSFFPLENNAYNDYI